MNRLPIAPLFFIVGILLQGCAGPLKTPWIESTYKPLPPLRLDVMKVDVEKEYIAPEEPPFVDHNFSHAPVDMLEQWANRYLIAAGRVGRAVVKIQEASIVEHIEERGKSPSIPYTGRIEVRIEFYGPEGEDQGFTRAAVTRTHHIPFELSVPDRQKAWRVMVEEMLGTLEPIVQQNIYKHAPAKLFK